MSNLVTTWKTQNPKLKPMLQKNGVFSPIDNLD